MKPYTHRFRSPSFRALVANLLGDTRRLVRRETHFDSDRVMEWARVESDLDDFGSDFQPHLLNTLLESGRAADLTYLGRRNLFLTVASALGIRLRYIEVKKRSPEIFTAPVEPPIIILGPPRSGTTVLQRLLALHPDMDALPLWELVRPIPPRLVGSSATDRRREQALFGYEYSRRYRRSLDHIHLARPDAPSECILLLTATLRSYRFLGLGPLYSYAEELKRGDAEVAYREYRDLLAILQHVRPGRPMVLKAPSHTGYLGEILRAVPNARIVTTHRNPTEWVPSILSLHRAQYSNSCRTYDTRRHSLAHLDLYCADAERYLEARKAHEGAIHDVHYTDFMADPVDTVLGIYRRFGVRVPDGHDETLSKYLRENPKGKHGRHRYGLADFGVSETEVLNAVGRVSETLSGRVS